MQRRLRSVQKKRDARAKLLFCQSKLIAFFPFSLPSLSSLIKLRNTFMRDQTLLVVKLFSMRHLAKGSREVSSVSPGKVDFSCSPAQWTTFQASHPLTKSLTTGLFTWSGGPRSSGVGFFCFHALEDTKQKKPTRPGSPTPCKQGLRRARSDLKLEFNFFSEPCWRKQIVCFIVVFYSNWPTSP